MCQDPERSVRATACRCLAKLSVMGKECLEGQILKEVRGGLGAICSHWGPRCPPLGAGPLARLLPEESGCLPPEPRSCSSSWMTRTAWSGRRRSSR